MVDFTGLISSGGGLLGLWLGLSCLDSVKLVIPFIEWIMNLFKKDKHKPGTKKDKIGDKMTVNDRRISISVPQSATYSIPRSSTPLKSKRSGY